MRKLITEELREQLLQGTFGLERETLRVDVNGCLAQTPHPFDSKYIDRDFCESQIELITPVCHSVQEMEEEVRRIDAQIKETLRTGKEKEYVWPFSNPPVIIDEDHIHVANYVGELEYKKEYRHYLAEKYGKRKMLFCGIHYNYAFPPILLELFAKQNGLDRKRARDNLYLHLAAKIASTSWFPVYLMAASPVMDASYLEGGTPFTSYHTGEASPRSGKDGYWNDFVPVMDYSSMDAYCASILDYVKKGAFDSASEWYWPVRVKPRGENTVERLRDYGADHIELRMLDVNPLSDIGMFREDMEFLHLYILYLTIRETYRETIRFGGPEQEYAVQDQKNAALYDLSGVSVHYHGEEIPIEQAAKRILGNMEEFFASLGMEQQVKLIQNVAERSSGHRYADRVEKLFGREYVKNGMKLAKYYSDIQERGEKAKTPEAFFGVDMPE